MTGKELEAVVQGNGQFTKKLYNVLAEKDGNVFFSPISAHVVLSMAFQGSKGPTYEAFAKTLAISDATVAAEGYNTLLKHLNNVSDVELSIVNRIYIMQGYSLKSTFQEISEKKYLSDAESVNFRKAEEAAKNINGWVEEKTKNKIKDIIQPEMLDETTRLVLVNATYFKGAWAETFDSNCTQSDKFYINDNDSVDVQMMRQKKKFRYKNDKKLKAKILELPYMNLDVSLIVILPSKRNRIGKLEKKLKDFDLAKITENMQNREVIVKLPKFKIETTIDLYDALKEMGLGIIFDKHKADFSGMLESPYPLVVSKVIQKAFIEVNEEGTEAAAATDSLVYTTSFERRRRPKEFFADHPFVVMMVYNEQTILFQGRIFNPLE